MFWMIAALIAVGVAAVVVLVAASSGNRLKRGGMIDLTGAQPRGELDLDWSDPRLKQTAREFSDHLAEQAKIAARH